jgi:hypothetical protein
MQVEITATTPIFRSPQDQGVFIQWVIRNPTPNAIANVVVYRSGAPEGPFEKVLDNIQGFHFYDSYRSLPTALAGDYRENLNFLSLSRTLYYKVVITDSANVSSEAVRAVMPGLARKQALLKRKILRDESVALKFNGIDLAVLKRKHWGLRCKACFDLLTKKVTNSKCPVCYGTGFDGGYFAPVRIHGRIGVANVQTQMTPQGNADLNKRRLIILNYPIVDVYDIVADVRQNRRYLVEMAHGTELRTSIVHQDITLSEIAKDAVEYRLPVNYDTAPVMY